MYYIPNIRRRPHGLLSTEAEAKGLPLQGGWCLRCNVRVAEEVDSSCCSAHGRTDGWTGRETERKTKQANVKALHSKYNIHGAGFFRKHG